MTDASQSQDSHGDRQAAHCLLQERIEQEQDQQQWIRDCAEAGPSGSQQSDSVEPTPPSPQPNDQPEPYFPLGLALSATQPTSFNFGLFLFDSLQLPWGLFDGDCEAPVTFDDIEDCNTYCNNFVANHRLRVTASDQADNTRQGDPTAVPDKAVLFRHSGKPLGPKLKTDNPLFDRNLDHVRLDQFGNVMFLFAHPWSDISVQFTHGFPRRLVSQAHGGMLPGNVTAAARVSNQAIRSLAPGDVAAFISRDMIQGLGLTTAELALARNSAVKYAGKQDKPSRLVGLMFRYGIDFLHLTALTVDQMQTLSETTTQHWNLTLRPTTDPEASLSDTSSDSEDSHQLTVSWALPDAECGDDMPPPDHERREQRVHHHVHSLMFSYLRTSVEGLADEPDEPAVQPRPTTSSSCGVSGQRKRKRKTRRPVLEDNNQDQNQNPPVANIAEIITQAPDARQCLLALPQIVPTRIPGRDSIKMLSEFFRQNEALPPRSQEPSGETDIHETPYVRQQTAVNNEALKTVWDVCKRKCVCVGTPIIQVASSTEQNCPYCILDEQGQEPHVSEYFCPSKTCRVCFLMRQMEISKALKFGNLKNERLRMLMDLSTNIGFHLFSEDISQQARTDLAAALCTILCCSETRLRSIANFGVLFQMCNNMKHLKLVRGWGQFWNNLSKFGVAIGYQKTERNKLATLLYLRHSCLPNADSNWHYYLQTRDRESEDNLMSTVFADCFNAQHQPYYGLPRLIGHLTFTLPPTQHRLFRN